MWMLQDLPATEGFKIGRRRLKGLMQRMRMGALYCRPRTAKPEHGPCSAN
jgi:hypothetical protein